MAFASPIFFDAQLKLSAGQDYRGVEWILGHSIHRNESNPGMKEGPMSQMTAAPLAILACAIFVSGCGGGDDTSSDYKPRAGDPFFVSVEMDGKTLSEDTYRYYTVADAEGTLSATPVANDETQPHVALFESRIQNSSAGLREKSTPRALPFADIQSCYKELWKYNRALNSQFTADQVATEIGDFDGTIEAVCEDAWGSGLSIEAYVGFYAALDKSFPEEINVEGELRDFLNGVDTTPAEFVGILTSIGYSWDAFLARMAATKTTFPYLLDAYSQSQFSLGDFLKQFMTGQTASTPPARPKAAAKGGLDIAKFAWEVIKDTKPTVDATGIGTRVLSSLDPAWEDYQFPTRGETGQVVFIGKNLFTMVLFKVPMHVDGYYNATNKSAEIGGRWIPGLTLRIEEAYAAWTWRVNGTAEVTNPVNLGSADSPEPEIDVVAHLRANGLFQAFQKDYVFIANGAKGFRSK